MKNNGQPYDGAPRCIIGARVSTDEQYKKGVSIEQQLEAGREKAEALGGRVIGYCVEPGVSGALYESRDELQNALRQIEEGRAEILIWYDLSRMSRDIEYISAIEKRVRAAGGQLQFVTTEYSNTADGFLHRGIDSVIHQHQRLKTKELSAASRLKLVRSGRQTQRACSPIGYHIVTRKDLIRGTHTEADLGHYEVVEDQAAVVREIFERYAAGDSLREICRDLQARAVPTPAGGTTWRPSAIRNILQNSAYRGKATFGKTRNVADETRVSQGYKRPWRLKAVDASQWIYIDCPAIVTEELWRTCQERLTTAKAQFSATAAKRHALSGLIRCPKCNRCMSVVSRPYEGKRKRRVICHCPSAYPGLTANRQVCVKDHFWEDELLNQIKGGLIAVVERPDLLERATTKLLAAQKSKYSDKDLERLKNQLAVEERRGRKAVEAQIQAAMKEIDGSVYDDVIRDSMSKQRQLRSQIEKHQAARLTVCELTDFQSATPFDFTNCDNKQFATDIVDIEANPLEFNKWLSRLIEAAYPSKSGLKVVFRAGAFGNYVQYIWQNGHWSALPVDVLKPIELDST